MRTALPILVAALFCSACLVFILGVEDTARVFGAPDGRSCQKVPGYIVIVMQPWVLVASSFRDHWFSVLVFIECAAAILFAALFLWLRRWNTIYRVTIMLINALSVLLLFCGWRMHAAVFRADQQYEETFGRYLQ